MLLWVVDNTADTSVSGEDEYLPLMFDGLSCNLKTLSKSARNLRPEMTYRKKLIP